MSTLMLRRRPVATPATIEKPKTDKATPPTQAPLKKEAPVQRPAVAGSATDNHQRLEKAKQAIEAQLKLISESYDAIDAHQAAADQASKVIEAQLRLVNLTEHDDGVYRAKIAEVWSRQSRKIDPKKFKACVASEVFWDSVNVNIGKAEEYLSAKELNTMSDVVPSKLTGRVLKIEKIKTKNRTRKS